jgi:hypothetical protein
MSAPFPGWLFCRFQYTRFLGALFSLLSLALSRISSLLGVGSLNYDFRVTGNGVGMDGVQRQETMEREIQTI